MSRYILLFFFFFKQKTAYEMRISDWSSDVCSSDLLVQSDQRGGHLGGGLGQTMGLGQRQRLHRGLAGSFLVVVRHDAGIEGEHLGPLPGRLGRDQPEAGLGMPLRVGVVVEEDPDIGRNEVQDRKSTRLNSSP